MKNRPATPTVMAMHQINFADNAGNIIPHKWYKHILLGRRADAIGIMVLAELVYWYRPTTESTRSNKAIVERRFDDDKLQMNPRQLEDKLGFSQKQIRDAIKRLSDSGLIEIEIRKVRAGIGVIPNVMYIEVVPSRIKEITELLPEDIASADDLADEYPEADDDQHEFPMLPTGEPMCPTGHMALPTGHMALPTGHATKNTTKITTENNTTNTSTKSVEVLDTDPTPSVVQETLFVTGEPSNQEDRAVVKKKETSGRAPVSPHKDNPAVLKFKEYHKRSPNRGQMEVIANAGITDLDKWLEVMIRWNAAGYNPVNIDGQINWYKQGIQARKDNNNHANRKPLRIEAEKGKKIFYVDPDALDCA